MVDNIHNNSPDQMHKKILAWHLVQYITDKEAELQTRLKALKKAFKL